VSRLLTVVSIVCCLWLADVLVENGRYTAYVTSQTAILLTDLGRTVNRQVDRLLRPLGRWPIDKFVSPSLPR
jgi:hypothetical protein